MKHKRIPLSAREVKIYDFLQSYYQNHTYMPTRAEIASGLKIRSAGARQSVDSSLQNMEAKGVIKLGRGWREIFVYKIRLTKKEKIA